MEIRSEKLQYLEAIREVNIAAFGRENEANLVDQLRGVASTLSFVAIEVEQVIGHIFFSPVSIEGDCSKNLLILGLAPIAVLPNYQRQGIASELVQYSLQKCAQLGYHAVVVLGAPNYYSRFGFVRASEKGLRCEYLVPDEAFMVLELTSGALQGCRGTVKYCSEFRECE